MPLHPQAKMVLDQMAALGQPPLGTLSPAETRKNSKARQQAQRTGVTPPPVHEVSDRTIPGPGGPIAVRIYRPTAAPALPVLLWFHGGGWVLGDLDGSDLTCRALANGAGCIVVSVDYRLAPESRFPAAADDAYAATQWVAGHAAELGADARRIAVGGDSAGGNLAAVVTLMARDRGGPAIVHQALVYPVTNYSFDTASYRENAEGYVLSKASMQWFWDHYLGPDGDGRQPYASPLRAPDLSRLPSALVITAEFDPLRDEGEAFARRLQAAGVAAVCTRYDGMIHGFFGMSAMLDDAKRALAQAAQSLRAAFAR
ncbi:MAG: alpha/beta hydrolase [Dehalococcoidia bacterium]|nr:alpha/beta hydrolase [Dehalococcoidia bacterium]